MHIRRLFESLLISCVLLAPAVRASELDEVDWKLQGIDVFGHRRVSREEILGLFPLHVGDSVKPKDKPVRQQWCDSLKVRYGFAHTDCMVILVQPNEAYLSIDVVEPDETQRLQYADRWKGGLRLSTELKNRLEEFTRLQTRKFSAGVAIVDIVRDREYVDYEDAELHRIAMTLHSAVPKHRAEVLEVVAHGESATDRADAATLLNWAGKPAMSAAEVYRWLDDPDEGVRNNIARFLIQFAPTVREHAVRLKIVHALAAQLDRPSALDRNKALFALNALVDADSSLAVPISEATCDRVLRIARTSAMPNVGGEAQRLIPKLHAVPGTSAACSTSPSAGSAAATQR